MSEFIRGKFLLCCKKSKIITFEYTCAVVKAKTFKVFDFFIAKSDISQPVKFAMQFIFVHEIRDLYILRAILKSIRHGNVGIAVIDKLSHQKFVKIGIKTRFNNRIPRSDSHY